MLSRWFSHACIAFTAMVSTIPLAHAQTEPVRIGEINSYTRLPAFTEPYKKGWQLAVEEINQSGGVLGGRPLEVISRDDAGKPANAIRHARELIYSAEVDVLAGTFFSHIGLAVSDLAKKQRILFLAGEPLTDSLVWDRGNRYTFRLRPSTSMQAAMLAEAAARLPAKRWATIAPNYEYGKSAVLNFKQLLSALRPDVEFVAEQWPALGKIDAAATAQAIAAAEPDAIFNATFGADLAELVRQGSQRGLFEDRNIVSLLTGEPEYLLPLNDKAPEGWIVTGYPYNQINTRSHQSFRSAYIKKYNEEPKLGSVVGYTMIKALARAFDLAGTTNSETLIHSMRGMNFRTPFGPAKFRAVDHQATMGAFIGLTAMTDGTGYMSNWRYLDGSAYLPTEEETLTYRPKEALK